MACTGRRPDRVRRWLASGPASNGPGRIELLGNHLDYNGGPVLAAAIDRAVVVLATNAEADAVRVVAADAAEDQPAVSTIDVRSLADWRLEDRAAGTFDYVRGVVAAILARPLLRLRPADIAFAGDVPIGFGVSSSAALCVGLGLALTEPVPEPRELVLLAQEAEHRVGAPVGTMDQSASVAGGVIRFDGATLAVERLTPDLGDLVFAVADSGVKRSLSTSSYPTRVTESKRALGIAREILGAELPSLAAISLEQLAVLTGLDFDVMPAHLIGRVRHVVTETERVRQGVEALRAADWSRFGRLMIESGRSSATDYAISHPRVEDLVGEALAVGGVLGARMMGGGEGGTALVLLPRQRVPALEEALRAGYYSRHGMTARDDLIYICAFADGARVETIG